MGQTFNRTGAAAAPSLCRRRDPFLNVLFARRRRRLLRFLTMGARNDPPSGTPRISGRTLLSLPEDVMVRPSAANARVDESTGSIQGCPVVCTLPPDQKLVQ